MSKSKLKDITQKACLSISRHSPEILTGLGVIGVVSTVVMAVKATPKALMLVEEIETEYDEENNPIFVEATLLEKAKAAWKCYIPTAVVGSASIACIIGASSVNMRRNAVLATAYTLSETALKEYQEKVVETIGEKKNREIKDAIAKDKIEKKPVKENEIIITGNGNTLCYDVIYDKYFLSDIEKIRKAVNELNRQMLSEMYVSLNDFYYMLGLKGIPKGDDLGWNIDDGLIDIYFSSQLAERNAYAPEDTPCLVIEYSIAPRYDYYQFG